MDKQDNINHLNLLGIFHYVLGGMITLSACLLTSEVATVILFSTEEHIFKISWIGIVSAVGLLSWWGLAICLFLLGRKLRQRKNRTFSMVVAGVESVLLVPLGTVLGIFTLIALNKESVKGLYASEKE